MDDVVDLVDRSLADETRPAFRSRVEDQADALREGIAAGRFDSDGFAIGLEVELYGIWAPPAEEEEDTTDTDPADQTETATDAETGQSDALRAINGTLLGGSTSDGIGRSDREQGTGWRSTWDASAEAIETAASRLLARSAQETNGAADPAMADHASGQPDELADWAGTLTPLPESLFGGLVATELGLHNAEINTEPDPFDQTGLDVQTAAVELQVKKAREMARAHDHELVLDGMWTVPPAEGSDTYLGAHQRRDEYVVADNMRQYPRYVAIDNDALADADGSIDLSMPGVEGQFPTILFESLTSSIQPHLQIPTAAAFPAYYNAAIRTLGPVLALTANSPFLPADLYEDVTDPDALLAELHHESRIAVFEQSVNTSENPKVRVPRDIDTTTDVVDSVLEDDCFAPFMREWIHDEPRETVHDEHWEFDHKRGTYWRWLRCVIGGDPVGEISDEESLRIEYRPMPTQPTPKDLISAQVLVTGLIRGLGVRDHPLTELPWEAASESFYSAAEDGLDADLDWVTADGERTTDTEVIFDEVFDLARAGLAAQEIDSRRIDQYLDPMERRVEAGMTPSAWKIERVRENLAAGHPFSEAITAMQREYIELSQSNGCFADWL
jgi:hypothetical protein